MTERRPDEAGASQLTIPISEENTDIPVASITPFRLDADKRIGPAGEFIRCTGMTNDPWPMLTGCVRGLRPEDGGVKARSWPADTLVYEAPWTTVESVTEYPAEPDHTMVGRKFVYDAGDGNTYSYRVIEVNNVPAVVWEDAPPEEDQNFTVASTIIVSGLGTNLTGVAVDPSGNYYVVRTNPVLLDQWWLRKYSAANALAWEQQTDYGDDGWNLYWDTDNGGVYVTFNIASGLYNATTGDQIFSSFLSSTIDGTRLGLATDGITLYVVEPAKDWIYYSTADAFVDDPPHFGSSGSGNLQFSGPTAAFIKSGELFVLDAGNGRIQVIDATTRAWIRNIVFGVGSTAGKISSSACGIVVDSLNRIWIGDTGNHRVQVFDSTGVLLFVYGSLGTGTKHLNTPRQLALGAADKVYVADTGNGRIVTMVITPTVPLVTKIASLVDGEVLRYDSGQEAFVNAGITPVITPRNGVAQNVAGPGSGVQEVTCAAGEVSIGGGVNVTGSPLVLMQSFRVGTTGWFIGVRNTGSSTLSFTPMALCLKVPL